MEWHLFGIKPSDCCVNSLWPSDTIWRQRPGSTLAQVMAWCLTAPSHYLNQCWLIISKVLWLSREGNFTRDASIINNKNLFENYMSKISFKFPRGQWVNSLLSHVCKLTISRKECVVTVTTIATGCSRGCHHNNLSVSVKINGRDELINQLKVNSLCLISIPLKYLEVGSVFLSALHHLNWRLHVGKGF